MTTAEIAVAGPRSRRRRLIRKRFLRRPVAVASLAIILVFVTIGVFAPYVAPYGQADADFNNVLAHPSWQHLFGTDELGRDVFSRLVWGARISFTVGFLATGFSLLVALPIGLLAGYYRGWVDSVVARVTDVMLAFPFVILAIGLAAILGPSLTTTTVAVGIAGVPGLVRITRGETLALREADFVPAAVASGAGDATIVLRHVLPNMSSTLLVWITVHIPRAIIGEATLSFLGLGVRVPNPSWGATLHSAQSYLTTAPRLAVYPGLAIVIVALAFNLVGDALRDILDPRTTR
jgi:peptide/nickel transport system permease protein